MITRIIVIILSVIALIAATALLAYAHDEPELTAIPHPPCAFVLAVETMPTLHEVPCAMAVGLYNVMECESHFKVDSISATQDYGLMQINKRWQEDRVARMGYSFNQMLTAEPNIRVAVNIWQDWGQSFNSWSCGR